METRYSNLMECIPFQGEIPLLAMYPEKLPVAGLMMERGTSGQQRIPVLKGDKENMEYKRRIKSCFKYVILIAAIISICVGVSRNEPKVVLRKAANICFECIGIG